MDLSVKDAATLLGKSPRTVRHMAKTGALPARRVGGQWMIDPTTLAGASPEHAARRSLQVEEVRQRIDRAVEQALPVLPSGERGYYTVRGVRTFDLASDALAGIEALRTAHTELSAPLEGAARHLRRCMQHLTDGVHQFHAKDKVACLVSSRSRACAALADILHILRAGPLPRLDDIAELIERDLLRSLRGLLRHTEEKKKS